MNPRFVFAVAILVAVTMAVLGGVQLPGTYSTFNDSATGSQQVKATANFVPTACQGIHSTLAGWNIIKGNNANNSLNGTNGDDLIWGLGGDDTITGGGGADCIVGGDGTDTLSGGNQNDVLLGGSGNDGLNGDN
ncbi:MAG: hypothetical protein ABIP58_08140, partial [Dehalococcoidia bacterium]